MEQKPLFRPRVLIVEDEAIVAMEIQDQMESMGWEVCALAATGPDAIRRAEACRPDLILMDITLRGDMTGLEAAEKIKAGQFVPIIFLTASVDDRIFAHIRNLDPEAASLSKPFSEDELRREAERALRRRKR